jgi:arabinosaccharide transport system permease protein
MGKKKYSRATIPLLIIFIIIAAITLFPFYCITLASFKPGVELLRYGLNTKFDLSIMSFHNYIFLFTGDNDYFLWFKNSSVITVFQTVLTLFTSALVGYGFAMYDFKFKNILFTCVLIIMMVPIEILMLPLYKMLIGMKLIDTMWGIFLPFLASPLPIFFFRQYLSGIPRDFMDAARVDGCTEYGIFAKIMLPLMTPSFAAMGIFVAMNSWNGFLWPLIVLRSPEKLTLPIALAALLSPYGNNYNLLIAGSVFAILPILILFFFFQKYFIEGMTAGGVKG